jgi:hypothetical protein
LIINTNFAAQKYTKKFRMPEHGDPDDEIKGNLLKLLAWLYDSLG